MDKKPKGYITPREYAALHGVPIRTVYYWIKKGFMKVKRFNIERLLVKEDSKAMR